MSEHDQPGNDARTTRRALLAATIGGAAAVAAQAALPLAAQAHDPDDIESGVTNVDTTTTGIDTSATADVDAFAATASGTGSAVVASANGTGAAVEATAADAPAVEASNSGVDTAAAVYATSGDASTAATPAQTAYTGAYAFTETVPEFLGTGAWGDSDDTGVLGTGGNLGVLGSGFWGVYGESSSPGGTAIYAFAQSTDRRALYVDGKVGFRRSGRTSISAGHSSRVVSLPGVTVNSLVFAQLGSNRSGRWVRAVVPSAGKFTVYLNTTVSSSTWIIWWVIN
jgi:hypothetical protein